MGGIELAPLVTKIKVDIAGFKSEMEQVKTEAVSKANEVSKSLESTAKVGQQMSKVGGALTIGLSIPLAGAGIAAGKMAVDFESSFAKVSTLLDANVTDYGKYKNDILDASTNSKIAVDEFSEAVYESISAGVDQTKAIGFTTDAMKLAKGGFTDGAKAVDVITTAINAYGLETKDATKVSDMLITTQNVGKTTVDELASSIGRVIPTANAFNVDLKNVSTTMALLTKNGIATAESTTYYNSMLNDLGTAGTKADQALREMSGKGFAQLTKEGVPLTEMLGMLKEHAEASGKSLGDMFNAEASKAAMTIMKDGGVEYNDILVQMENSAGATQAAFEKMDAAPAEKFKGALNSLKNSGIKLGEAMIPMINKLADGVGVFAEKISKLTPEQAEMILKIGATVIAIGPLLKIGGSLITGYTKLKPLINGVSTAMSKGIPILGKFGSSLSTSGGLVGKFGSLLSKLGPSATTATTGLATVASSATGVGTTAAVAGGATGVGGLLTSIGGLATAALPWVAGAAAVGAAAYGVYKVLDQDVIPEVDLFKSKTTVAFDEVTGAATVSTVKISEETKKQVQSYMDLSNSAQQESMNMYLGIDAVTTENVAKITSKVGEMSTSIVTSIDNQKNEVVGKYQEMFNSTTAITTQEQTEIMTSVTTSYESRKQKTEELKNELTRIHQEAADSGIGITKKQQVRIGEIYNEMKTLAVQSMSSSKAEQDVILNNLNESSTRITADMAGKAIREMNKIETESVKSAKSKRDELIRQASELSQIEGGKYKEKADEIIKQANREYKETVTAAGKMKTEGVDKLMSAHSDLANKVDKTTGDVVSWWDKMFGKWDQWNPQPKVVKTSHVDEYITTGSTSNGKKNGKGFNMYAATGYEYVPYDGYNARLHEGERVLTKKENTEYTNSKILGEGKGGKVTLEIPLNVNGKEFAHATIDDIAEELGWR